MTAPIAGSTRSILSSTTDSASDGVDSRRRYAASSSVAVRSARLVGRAREASATAVRASEHVHRRIPVNAVLPIETHAVADLAALADEMRCQARAFDELHDAHRVGRREAGDLDLDLRLR